MGVISKYEKKFNLESIKSCHRKLGNDKWLFLITGKLKYSTTTTNRNELNVL